MARSSVADRVREAKEKLEEDKKHNRKILNQIRNAEEEKASLGNLCEQLNSYQNQIKTTTRKYKTKKKTKKRKTIVSDVVVKGEFEGNAAKTIQSKNQSFFDTFDARISSAESIADSIAAVESELQTKMSGIDTSIRQLRGKLR